MSGNNNVTVALPGDENWAVWWQWRHFDNFQLDIVGFLAVLGEGAVLCNSQVSALSRLIYIPRLLPAPQALLRTCRPKKLPTTTASVTGVHSGNVKDYVHHVAHILLGEEMPTFTVRCVEVTKKKEIARQPTLMDHFFRGTGPKRAATHSNVRAPLVKAKATGPQSWVTLIGFLLSLVLLVASVTFGDGMSILACISLSSVSTIAGIANKWTLRLPKATSMATAGDVVIRYPNGSYLVVRCDEDIARELYFAPEEIDYDIKSEWAYRLLSLIGTILLMLGIVFLANAKLQLQFGWAGAYIIINIAYWIAAALPQRLHWDLSVYAVEEQGVVGGPRNSNFTEALWKAILLTKSTRWVKVGGAAPRTDVWDDWLVDAETKAKEYSSFVDELTEPIWGCQKAGEGIVWDGPNRHEWDPKKVWDALNNDHVGTQEKVSSAEPTTLEQPE